MLRWERGTHHTISSSEGRWLIQPARGLYELIDLSTQRSEGFYRYLLDAKTFAQYITDTGLKVSA